MFITFTTAGLIACISIIVVSQVAKWLLKKFKVSENWSKFLPLIILLISYIVYSILLKDWGFNSMISAVSLTAISCYTYDVFKAIVQLFKSIFHKE